MGMSSYLSFWQTEVDSQFRFPPDGDVSVEMKLLLQLQSLMVRVHYPVFLLRSRFTCERKKNALPKIQNFLFFWAHLSARWLNWKTSSEQAACQDRPIWALHLYWQHLKSTSLWLLHRYANRAFWSCFDDGCSKWISNRHESDRCLTSYEETHKTSEQICVSL